MPKTIATAISILALGAALLALVGCTRPHPYVREGDRKSVQVTFYGTPDSALPVARQHCAGYDRVPRLTDAGPDIAYFDCVPR